MNAFRFCAVLVALCFAGASMAQDKQPTNKLPDDVVKVLEKAGELEVYSLDSAQQEKGNEGWHGVKVLGKTTVKGEDAAKVAASVKKGVEEGGRGARCFIPRHGIRATYDGKTVELVICFECSWIHVYAGDANKPQVLTISGSPHKPLDKILTDAKIKLAKPAK